MPYLLDANIFIQAKNLHYGFDFCPAFWDWLILKNTNDYVFSIEKVGDELIAGNDSLADWAQARGINFFLKPDQNILPALGSVSSWVASQNYESTAVNAFLQDADYYLISHALANGYTVITHEVPGNSRKRIKIPDVCIGLDVKCMNPYEMLRLERAKFILGPMQ